MTYNLNAFCVLAATLQQKQTVPQLMLAKVRNKCGKYCRYKGLSKTIISKQRIHIISFEPISRGSSANSIHEISMTSMSIDVIGQFWRGNEKRIGRDCLNRFKFHFHFQQ